MDPELADLARRFLWEPCETKGKGWHMSALGKHEITAGMGLGLEPPLSPPVVRGPSASSLPMPANGNGNLADLPTPPPATRPPESAGPASALQPPSTPQAEVPRQPQPEQAPAPVQPEPTAPIAQPAPAQLQPETPAAAPEPELPAMAPAEEPQLDYFATPEPAAETAPEIPAEDTSAELVQLPEIQPIPVAAPALPAEEPAAPLPTMAPPEPAVESAPATFVAPQPVEAVPEPIAEIVAKPELALAPADPFEAALPALEPLAVTEPVVSSELEELFAAKRSGQFRVVVRLKEGDGVEVGSFRDFGTAMEGAQEVIEQYSNASEGQWPFYAGRFIRPDLIVSVDVVDGDEG